MDFVVKECSKCHKIRKYVKDSLRDKETICGNCWDWKETDDEYIKRKGLNNRGYVN